LITNWIPIAMAVNYESEFTQFLKQYKEKHPDVEQRQREGRARLWDKPLDPDLLEGFKQAKVPQRPYVYQND
jgi:putative IMPACT (imprinted ancient) family translation regulator